MLPSMPSPSNLDARKIAERLGVAVAGNTIAKSVLQIAVPVMPKRSRWAMRLILPSGEKASARVDDNLVAAIATAHGWWHELTSNPLLRVSDLAQHHGVTKSWITRILRLAFLDPAIVEQVIGGTAPAHLTLDTLRSPESVPALWSAQRARHRIGVAP